MMLHAIVSILLVLVAALSSLAQDTTPADFRNVQCSDQPPRSPTYGVEKPVFSVCSQCLIDAPLSQVYNTIIGFDKYPQWNTFVINVKPVGGSLQNVKQGDEVIFSEKDILPLELPYETHEIISVLEQQSDFNLIAWKLNDQSSGNLQRAEHTWILTVDGSGKTRVVSYENFYGTLSIPTEVLKGKLQSKFDQQNRNLGRYVEGHKRHRRQ